MKLLHVADLHIGKRVSGLSMIDEQLNVIGQLKRIAIEEHVAGVLIAGDVFDKSIPSREALEACEKLFSAFVDEGISVFAIPGNHDSPQQLAFCSALLASSGLHIAKAFDGVVERFEVEQDGQRAYVHLLPFVRPTDVRMALPEQAADIHSHDDAVRVALAQSQLVDGACNILVAHQFVTSGAQSPQTCDSEVISVGGTDNVDASAFDAFDYVALGHLHGAQHVGRPTVRYSGSPLKYSFSEVDHEKSATILTIEDGTIEIATRALEPIHDMREVTAAYAELEEGCDTGERLDYMHVTLTDPSLPDALAKLRALYPNILRLDWAAYKALETRNELNMDHVESLSPIELFARFYEQQTGLELTQDEREAIETCVSGEGA